VSHIGPTAGFAGEGVDAADGAAPADGDGGIVQPQNELLDWPRNSASEHINIPADDIDANEPLSNLGLESTSVMALARRLSTYVGRNISPTILYSYPTITKIAAHLASEPAPAAPPPPPRPAASSAIAVPRPLQAPPATAARVAAPSYAPGSVPEDAIAVVGMSCRYPGSCHSMSEFWSFLLTHKDGVLPVRPDRWDTAIYLSEKRDIKDPGKMVSPNVGSYDEMDKFDPKFFGISPREAERMDPQQRLMLECSWEALEDAGIPPDSLAQKSVGVFVGISYSDYQMMQTISTVDVNACTATGTALCIPPNRLSYVLDLQHFHAAARLVVLL
jgi:polyketide synthase 12